MTWSAAFFDDDFAEQHLARPNARMTEEALAFLIAKLGLRPGQTVFDQCCGIGSMSIPLAAHGYRVIGIDLIPSYIARAQKAAEGDCLFAAADAYAYVTPEPCDAAINWWTSFGYSPDDMQNLKMLQRVAESLKPGGMFALDYMNAPRRLQSFAAKDEEFSAVRMPSGVSVWESRLDRAQRMVVRTWHFFGKDGRSVEKHGGGAKLYDAADLERLFQAAGFTDIAFYGSTRGEPLSTHSPRCIVVARKAA